jgi:hypothetical protein
MDQRFQWFVVFPQIEPLGHSRPLTWINRRQEETGGNLRQPFPVFLWLLRKSPGIRLE